MSKLNIELEPSHCTLLIEALSHFKGCNTQIIKNTTVREFGTHQLLSTLEEKNKISALLIETLQHGRNG
jgi:hypothetical protein